MSRTVRVLTTAALCWVQQDAWGACPTQPPDLTVCAANCDHTDVASAVNAAGNQDTICVDPGVYAGGFAVDGMDLTLEVSNLGALTEITNGGGANELVLVENGGQLTMYGFTVGNVSNKRCFFVNDGGSTLILDQVTVTGCTESVDGAGIYLNTGTSLVVTGSVFDTNGPGSNTGGHLFANNAGFVDIYDTTFRDGSADSAAGVRLSGADGIFGLTTFDNNTTNGGEGGALWATDGDLTCDSCDFLNNETEQHGGAVFAEGSASLVIRDSWFETNTAWGDGGAILHAGNNNETLTIENTTFLSNRSDDNQINGGDGGGFHASNPDVTVTGSTFTGNYGSQGAGAYVTSGEVDIARSTFCDNDVDGDGGGLFLENLSGNSRVVNSLFQGNSAGDDGAGLYVDTDLEVRNNVLVDNSGTGQGDGLYCRGGTTDLVNNAIAYHTGEAVRDGGGSCTVAADYNLWFFNNSDLGGGSSPGNDAVFADPLFLVLTPNGVCDDDFGPQGGSPMVDAGDPTWSDLDGTTADIGLYGGPDAPQLDGDGDGFEAALDCDDGDPDVYPGAPETNADGTDQDCDGFEVCYVDNDNDSFGSGTVLDTDFTCSGPGLAFLPGDCDDAASTAFPGGTIVYGDGLDNDCANGEECYDDVDNDGYGVDSTVNDADLDCFNAPFHSATNDDCNDGDPSIHPGQVEDIANGVDQDCDGNETCWRDQDEDGYGSPVITRDSPVLSCVASGVSNRNDDCNDGSATTYPGANETVANGFDEDCDGEELCFHDADGDTYGVPNNPHGDGDLTCDGPNESLRNDDCDDGDPVVNPGAGDPANDGTDGDCDGFESCPRDADGDTYGAAPFIDSVVLTCTGGGVSPNTDDCDDGDPNSYPGANEVVDDGTDQDCNGTDTITCYQDLDQDGFGSNTSTLAADGSCDLAQLESDEDTDCADGDPNRYPGALEIKGDGIDQDCDGFDLLDCYEDKDNDNHGGLPIVLVTHSGDCVPEPFMADQADDCDDTNAAVFPGAVDLCGDSLDSDCDGVTDEDGDGLDWVDEDLLGTDDCLPDFDGDGLDDGPEVGFGTDPTLADSDGDTLLDGEEIVGGIAVDSDFDNVIDALDDDDDNDTLLTADELGVGGGDADGDGLDNHLDDDDDNDELLTRFEDADGSGTQLDDDTDGDKLQNWIDDDDDGDGLFTGDEVAWGTDHLSADSDGDTIDDQIEWGGGALPRDSELCPPLYATACPDGIIDVVDPDDDNDGIPSEVEGNVDLDLDTVPNYLDPDADGDGIFDIDEYVFSWEEDTDGDSVWNFLDDDDTDGAAGDPDRDGLSTNEEIAIGSDGSTPDSDGDGVHDGAEAPDPLAPLNTDGDDTLDVLDIDDDGDGRDTRSETGLVCPDGSTDFDLTFNQLGLIWLCPDGITQLDPVYRDTDADGIPDYADADDDGDGTPSVEEGMGDADGDGIPDALDSHDRDGPVGDADGDTIINDDEIALQTDPYDSDTDADGIVDPDELTQSAGVWIPVDHDMDGLHDAVDPDDDGDGVPTSVEGTLDTDGDGVTDHLDLDSDGDGKLDVIEAGLDADCDDLPDRVDADDEGPCLRDGETDPLNGGYARQGCGCDGTGGASFPFGLLGLLLLGARRRASVRDLG